MQNNSVPIAIVIAGILVAGSIFYVNKGDSEATNTKSTEANTSFKIDIKQVSTDDHILGKPDAYAKIVEYSDTDCPYCKNFHTTMKQVMDQYGKDGKVAWVYRHFPIDGLHPNARMQAEATECVASIKGSESFWTFLDSIYFAKRTNGGIASSELYSLSSKAGVPQSDLKKCVDAGTYKNKVEESVVEATVAGASGTPYNVIILNEKLSDDKILAIKELNDKLTDGDTSYYVVRVDSENKDKVAMFGALPFNLVKSILDIILA